MSATCETPPSAPPDALLLPGHGRLTLERAWPRPDRTVLLELRDERDQVVGARWCPTGVDPSGADPSGADTGVVVLTAEGGHAVLHLGGSDPRLPGLAADVARGGRLLSHRPGRRAVLHRPDGSFAKHVRPGAVGAVVGGLHSAAAALGASADVARVREVGPAGVVVLEPLPGRPLLALGRDGTEAELTAGWERTGALLATLHAARPGLSRWQAVDEVRAATRLVAPAVGAGLLPPAATTALTAVAEELLALPAPAREVPLHRDLHDQQVLLTPRRIGLLDCDTAISGDAAVDLGNLLAHLRLRVLQGLLTPRRAGLAERSVCAARGGADLDPDSVRAHTRLTLVRLAGLYAWRPRWRRLAPALLSAGQD